MNVAIYGGSFDPPHIAHLQIIQTVSEQLDIDQLIVIVAHQNPLKTACLFGAKKRYEWMQRLSGHLPKVQVSDIEIKQKKPIASIESVLSIKKTLQPKKIFFIIGQDNLASLPKWNRYEELKKLVEFVLVEREGYDLKPNEALQTLSLPNLKHKISSSQIRRKLFVGAQLDDLPKDIQDEVTKLYLELQYKEKTIEHVT